MLIQGGGLLNVGVAWIQMGWSATPAIVRKLSRSLRSCIEMILPADTGNTTTANVWLAVKGGEPSSATVTVTRLMEPSGPGLVQVITPAGLMETPGGAD